MTWHVGQAPRCNMIASGSADDGSLVTVECYARKHADPEPVMHVEVGTVSVDVPISLVRKLLAEYESRKQ